MRHQVERLEQHLGRAVVKGVLQRVDHQAIAVATRALQRDGRARHIVARVLESAALVGPARGGCIEREAITGCGEGPRWLRSLEDDSRGVQAKGLARRDGPHGNPVADGRALEPRERILASSVDEEATAAARLLVRHYASVSGAIRTAHERLEREPELDARRDRLQATLARFGADDLEPPRRE